MRRLIDRAKTIFRRAIREDPAEPMIHIYEHREVKRVLEMMLWNCQVLLSILRDHDLRQFLLINLIEDLLELIVEPFGKFGVSSILHEERILFDAEHHRIEDVLVGLA